MLLKINNTDYTGHIVDESYKVNRTDVYGDSYVDAGGYTHKRVIRQKIAGSLTLFFKKKSEVEAFLQSLENAKNNSTGSYNIQLTVNNDKSDELVPVDCFVEYELQRALTGVMSDYYKSFQIKIEER